MHETLTTDHCTWTVLDRVLPGTPLSQANPATVDPRALFEPLAAMADQAAPRPDRPSIFHWLRERLEDDHLTDLRPGTSVAPAGERETALALLDDLGRDHRPALCHGDASSGNIISSGLRDWKYIDPRGMSGEHTYDVAVLVIRIRSARGSPNMTRRIASLTQVALDRLDAWTAVASAARV
ncbi:aminoglycoside phosphotransferase family protein [Actinoplanes lutulentus]|uniref:aminoglycoside phosphotransferase family protein n=1 Tax=Actinoplanes lutulentus TaxID=1287878 RepID=UPI000DBA6C67